MSVSIQDVIAVPEETVRVAREAFPKGNVYMRMRDDLATVALEWLLEQVSPDWFDLYSQRFEQYRLPKEKAVRQIIVYFFHPRRRREPCRTVLSLWPYNSSNYD